MATNMISALGAGSGVDVKALAQSLVDAEKVPREDAINTKIDKQDRKVAGYSAMMLSLETLKAAFQKLNDTTDFTATQASSSDETSLSAYAPATAVPGTHTVKVTQLAAAQRSAMGHFSSATQTLNGGQTLELTLSINGEAQSAISVSTTTPQGVVDAINAAGQGVTAQLIDTGSGDSPYRIVLTGAVGAAGVFSLSTNDTSGNVQTDVLTFGAASTSGTVTVAGVDVALSAGDSAVQVADKVYAALLADDFMTGHAGRSLVSNADGTLTLNWRSDDGSAAAPSFVDAGGTGATLSTNTATAFVASDTSLDASNLQEATNAIAVVDGLTLTRSSNSLDDAIPGLYIDLKAVTNGTTATLRVTRDTTTVTANINNLVESYNNAISDFDILTGDASEDATDIYSGSLVGDSLVQRVKSQLRSMLLSDSTTPSGDVVAMRDIGFDIDRYGVLSVDATKLSAALANNFDDVVTMLSAGTSNQSEYGDAARGVAGDAVKSLNDLISSRSALATQSANATSRVSDYKLELEKLNTRMEALLARYTKQFGIMEAMVGQTNSMRDSLKSTFDGMMAAYTNQ